MQNVIPIHDGGENNKALNRTRESMYESADYNNTYIRELNKKLSVTIISLWITLYFNINVSKFFMQYS